MTTSTGKKRGRPKKPLADDPEKIIFLLMGAVVEWAKTRGISERSVALAFAALRYGQPGETPEDVAARGALVIDLLDPKMDRLDEKGTPTWRNRDVLRPLADDMRRKLRKLRERDPELFASASLALRPALEASRALRLRREDGQKISPPEFNPHLTKS